VAANFLSTSAGMTFSFLANGRHTFGASRPTVRQAILFLATNVFTMWVLQPLLIRTAYDVATAPAMVGKVVALAGTVVVNFLLYRYVVWPRSAAGVSTADPGGLSPSPLPAGLAAAPEATRR
jgi:putative flippase GtrA